MTSTNELHYSQQPDNKDIKHIDGDDGYPLIGRLPLMMKSILQLAQDQYQRFGPVSRFRAGPHMHMVLALGPENVQRILMDKDREFSAQKGYEYALTVFFGRGLLTYDFDEHRIQRRIMQTSFKTASMRTYVEMINPIVERDITTRWDYSKTFVFYPHIKKMLLDIAGVVFFGLAEDDPDNAIMLQAFLDILDGQMGIFRVDKPGFKFHKGMKARRVLEDKIGALIPSRRGAEGQDMLTMMCNETKEDGSFYTDEEIIPHASFLLFAAHDTTTSALSHLIYHLAISPEWQQKAREECLSLNKAELNYDDLDLLAGLDRMFKEALRLHPVVPLYVRRTTRELELSGKIVPANTQVCTIASFSHFMEEYWTSPETFDPDRFNDERAEHKRHAFSYVPFGGGAHKCIGMHFAIMNAKLFLHGFLTRYRFRLADDASHKMQMVPLPKPADGVRLIVEPLSQ